MKIAASCCGASRWITGLLLAAMLSGCVAPPSEPAARIAVEQTDDPIEPLNRQILEVNLFLDRILLNPATKVYTTLVPEEGRDALRHALDNMKEPVIVINNVLQGSPERASIAAGRFAVNTTFGLVGLIDVAKQWGLEKQSGDFGQTMFAWGLPDGPYLVLPLLGPSNPRDALGMAADAYMDPFSFVATAEDVDELEIIRFVLGGIDERARVADVLDDLQKNSIDFYAQLKSLAQQRRAAELRHGAAPPPAVNFYEDPGKAAPAAKPSPRP